MQVTQKKNAKKPKTRFIGKKKPRKYDKKAQINNNTNIFNDADNSHENYSNSKKRKSSSEKEDTREKRALYYKNYSTNSKEHKQKKSLNNSISNEYIKKEIKKDAQRNKKVNQSEGEKSCEKERDIINSEKVEICEGNENLINTKACESTRDINEREESIKENASDVEDSFIQKDKKTKDKRFVEGNSSVPENSIHQKIDDEKMKKIDSYSNDSSSKESSDYLDFQSEILSPEKLEIEIEKNEKNPKFVIKFRNSKKSEEISLEKIKRLLQNKDYENLKEYQFPFMNLGAFNTYIYQITIDVFRRLFFYCPICGANFRQYSLPYHIFQNHFNNIDEYLSEREIAMSCAILMKKEHKKIDLSLNIFSQLATLFESCKYKGNSEIIHDAEESINVLKELKIEERYFNATLEEAKNTLNNILPINKNKNIKRLYKPRVRKKEKIKYV